MSALPIFDAVDDPILATRSLQSSECDVDDAARRLGGGRLHFVEDAAPVLGDRGAEGRKAPLSAPLTGRHRIALQSHLSRMELIARERDVLGRSLSISFE